MAIDSNINKIKFLRTNVGNRIPTTDQIVEGELAFNVADRTIYTRYGNDIFDMGFGKGGTVNGDIFAPNNQIRGRYIGAMGGSSIGDGQGAWIGWNRQNGIGKTDFVNNQGGGVGGFDFWNGTSSSNMKVIASIDSFGNYIGNSTSTDKLKNARTVSVSGDVNGSFSFDGSGNVSYKSTVRNTVITTPENNWLTQWRTNFGVGNNEPFISVYRTGFDSDISRAHGSNFTWGNGDTHSFLSMAYGSNEAWVGAGNANKINWSEKLAFQSGNVASATKLRTPRSIWGQSFDGTGDVNGDLTTSGSILANTDNTIINIGNDQDLALVKKQGLKAMIAIGSNTTFTVAKSNAATVGIGNTFTNLMQIDGNGKSYFIDQMTINNGKFRHVLGFTASGSALQGYEGSGETYTLRGFADGNGYQLTLLKGGISSAGKVSASELNVSGNTRIDGFTYINNGLKVENGIEVPVSSELNSFKKLIYGLTQTDGGYVAVGNQGTDKGFVEIGTTDDSETWIYARQRGTQNQILRQATLLDPNGNASFPEQVYAKEFIGKVTGSSDIAQKMNIQNPDAINTGRLENNRFEVKKVYNNGYPTSYGNVLNIGGAGQTQMFIPWSGSGVFAPRMRSVSDVTSTWSDWNTLAFVSDNVASATKLQNPRRLNGTLFDGTTDVTINNNWIKNINKTEDVDTALDPGCYVIAGAAIAGLYGYGMLRVYRQNDNPNPTTQIYYAHQNNGVGSVVIRQSWDGGQTWSGWRALDNGFIATGISGATSDLNGVPWANNSGVYRANDRLVVQFKGESSTPSLQLMSKYNNGGLWYRSARDAVGFETEWNEILTRQTINNFAFSKVGYLNNDWTTLSSPNNASRIAINNSGLFTVYNGTSDLMSVTTDGDINANRNINASGSVNSNDIIINSGIFKSDGNHYINVGKNQVDLMTFGSYNGSYDFRDTQSNQVNVKITNGGNITLSGTLNGGYVYSRGDVKAEGSVQTVNVFATGTVRAAKLEGEYFPNNTLIPIGDDVKMGDGDVSGCLVIQTTTAASPGIQFRNSNGTVNSTIQGGNFSGNSASATKLQQARYIGGVLFDGTSDINLAGVNTTGNQDTTGSSNSVKFKNSDKAMTPQANWQGATFALDEIVLAYVDANTVVANVFFNGALPKNLLQNGVSKFHLLWMNEWWNHETKDLTVKSWKHNPTDASPRVFQITFDYPNHGIASGSSQSWRIAACTYYAVGCSFYGNIQQYCKNQFNWAQHSWLLKTDNEIKNGAVTITTVGDSENYNADYDIAWMNDGNGIVSGATMVKPYFCNFITTDNNNDTSMKASYVNININSN